MTCIQIVYKGFKTAIIGPTLEQLNYFREVSGACRWIYNQYVDLKFKSVRNRIENSNAPKPFSKYDFKKFLTVVKNCRCDPDNNYTWLNNYSRQTLNTAVFNAEDAFKRWAKGTSGKPRFKSRMLGEYRFSPSMQGFWRTRNGCHCEKIGNLKLRQTLPKCPEGTHYANPVIYYDNVKNKWYLSLVVPKRIKSKKTKGEVVGIDLGIKDTAITSYGKVYENINYSKRIRKLERRMKIIQRKVSKLIRNNIDHYRVGLKGGRVPIYKKSLSECKNYQKALHELKIINYKLNGIRDNFTHQMTYEIVSRPETKVVVIEDLNVSGMMKNRHLARSIQNQRFTTIRHQLTYKSKEEGIELIAADRFYPSSKICSNCGHKKLDLKLSDRTYVCDNCGTVIDRDLNAAINLVNYGKSKLPDYYGKVTSLDEYNKSQVDCKLSNENSDEAERSIREDDQEHASSILLKSVR